MFKQAKKLLSNPKLLVEMQVEAGLAVFDGGFSRNPPHEVVL